MWFLPRSDHSSTLHAPYNSMFRMSNNYRDIAGWPAFVCTSAVCFPSPFKLLVMLLLQPVPLSLSCDPVHNMVLVTSQLMISRLLKHCFAKPSQPHSQLSLTHLPHVQIAVQSPSSPVAAAQPVPDTIPATAVLATKHDGDNHQVSVPRVRQSSPLIMPRLLSFSPGAQQSNVGEDHHLDSESVHPVTTPWGSALSVRRAIGAVSSPSERSQARPGSAASVASGKSSLGSALAKYRQAATLRRSSLTGTASHSSKSPADLRLVTSQSASNSPSASSSSGRTCYSKGLMLGYGFRPAHVTVAEGSRPALRPRSPAKSHALLL